MGYIWGSCCKIPGIVKTTCSFYRSLQELGVEFLESRGVPYVLMLVGEFSDSIGYPYVLIPWVPNRKP